jgi:predicted XRE-type DNA-binding protein
MTEQDSRGKSQSDERRRQMIRSTRPVSWIKEVEVVKGSGNVFRDLGHKNADADQFKAILAAEVIKALDREGLSVRGAQGRTGIAAADFSRIRNADLGRFTVDRLMSIINRLGSRVEVKIKVRRVETVEHGMPA